MKKILSMSVALILALSLLTACGGTSTNASSSPTKAKENKETSAPEQTYTIKLAHTEPMESNEHLLAEKYKELLEERSGGRITVDIYPASQLGDENNMVESAQMNAVQITIPSAGAAARFYSPLNIFMMPFYLDGENELEKYHNLMGAIDSVWDDLNEGMIATSNLRLMAPFWYGDRCVTNNVRPITTPDDLVGINMRVPGQEIYAQVFKALGATTTTVAFSELYMALSQGVVDGQDNPGNSTYVKKLYEVQKYLTVTGHITQTQLPVISEIFYQSLPEDLQTMVIECMEEAAAYASELQAQDNMDIIDTLVELGMELSVADRAAFVEATKDIPSIMLDEEGMAYYKTLQAALKEVYASK